VNWAVVIGVDEYGHDDLRLSAAVADAEMFCKWVVDANGGNVPRENLRLLLARSRDRPEGSQKERAPTKDNIVTAINEVVTASGGVGERLYFFFAGHGITARVANRDESAIVTPGFDELHPDHSLAIRSLTEFFETTQFQDQFFFVDACRDIPWRDREFEIGRWPIPRRRNPGQPPVQQFILYATSPGLTAAEVGWPEEAIGAFTEVLMAGLGGHGRAKAWSWERNCYEVRWEKLATYVKTAMEQKAHPTRPPPGMPPGGWPIQVPQDAGSRGVAGRDRDALLASFPRFDPLKLTVLLKADAKYDEAEVSVLDAVGEPVVSALKVTGSSHVFTLAPKTYAIRARTTDKREGRVKAPIELYEDMEEAIELRPPVSLAPGQVSEPVSPGAEAGGAGPGKIAVEPADPLTVTELRDEAGIVVDVKTGEARFSVPAGFYRVRLIGPEATSDEQFVVLSPGEEEPPLELKPPKAPARVVALARAAGGQYSTRKRTVTLGDSTEPLQWASPSTILAVALGEALNASDAGSLERLGLASPRQTIEHDQSGVALYVVASADDERALRGLHVRLWAVGEDVPSTRRRLKLSPAGVGAFVTRVDEPGSHWLAIERGEVATVIALPVMRGRLATVVAQLEPEGMSLYQFHPVVGAGPSSASGRLRRVEHLERLLLGGRLDGAPALAEELAAAADEDPFAGCVAGYTLLRLGLYDRLAETVAKITTVAPELSDAHILRAEYEAQARRIEAAHQSFTEAVAVGIPAFGEGLTRLLEGLRASGYIHPRGALVRQLFLRHVRGTMWAAFTPRRSLEPGKLVITGADLGFEG
jgi:caspase domain-containing protein